MSDHETITLVGGPLNGETRNWDGGDYLTVPERPPVQISSKPFSDGYAELKTKQHLYQRARFADGTRSATFIYQGEQ